ncbi:MULTISPECIES: GNAT family N-acetyltransferase [Streptomyces diastaticus group]|uniref:GNAT family N-acetyltransferase n=1 Tax=Streptomyces diastaticus group TaxID=2849069 RepID=UPI0013B69EB7|nr:GNAT family N-acetyltransferase [Streptomyces sp. SID8455]WSU34347.1 GNAT family N-acetyltransferase [Streptomyces gougerotii]
MLCSSLLPLQGDGVRLRRLRAADAFAYVEGARDAAVRRYGHLPESEYTLHSVREMIDRDVDPGLESGHLAVLAIADGASDAFMGSLVLFDVTERGAEVGFWVHPAHRGRGATATALRLAARFASGSGLRELTARTLPENTASQRVLETAGFGQTGVATGATPSGQQVELLHYVRQVGNSTASREGGG